MGRPLRQLDVQKAIAGAIKGGMPAGSFRVEVDCERGRVLICPISGDSPADEDGLDAEIRKLMDGKG